MRSFKNRLLKRRPSAGGEAAAETETKTERPITARRSVGYLAGGGIVSTLLSAFSGLIIGRLVDPATLGLFNGIGLILPYAALLGLGVSSGLSRELPYFVGKGDRHRAEELAAVTQAWTLMVGGVVFTALLGVAGWHLAQGNLLEAAGWFSNAIIAFLLFYTDYLQVTYRTARDFAKLAKARVAQQIALVALLVLVVPLDFYGLCLRAILASALTVFLLSVDGPSKWVPIGKRTT